jgi:hypothetical protein
MKNGFTSFSLLMTATLIASSVFSQNVTETVTAEKSQLQDTLLSYEAAQSELNNQTVKKEVNLPSAGRRLETTSQQSQDSSSSDYSESEEKTIPPVVVGTTARRLTEQVVVLEKKNESESTPIVDRIVAHEGSGDDITPQPVIVLQKKDAAEQNAPIVDRIVAQEGPAARLLQNNAPANNQTDAGSANHQAEEAISLDQAEKELTRDLQELKQLIEQANALVNSNNDSGRRLQKQEGQPEERLEKKLAALDQAGQANVIQTVIANLENKVSEEASALLAVAKTQSQ